MTLISSVYRPGPVPLPDARPEPRINGARIFGARPGSPFLFSIAATGVRPLTFSAEGLPPGLALDPSSGIVTGVAGERGTHAVTLRATNAHGTAKRTLRIVIGDEIALTPPMGCNTYGGRGPFVNEQDVRASARGLIETGLVHYGYTYVNIDDGWQGRRGGPYNAIQPNEKFGDLRALCDDLHAMGLRSGSYSTPWTTSYEGFVGGSCDNENGDWTPADPPRSARKYTGRYRFAEQDARQISEWGFDYFKYDWGIDSVDLAREMGDALRATGRDIVYELSNSAPLADAAAYTEIGTMCRTTGDIIDVWDKSQMDAGKRQWALGVRDIWEQHKDWQPYNRPGHWNMPCPLRVGMLGGWDLKPLRPTRLTPDEQYTHISLWCLWSAPLIIGCPPELLDEFTLSLLTNDEVLELDQDPLGLQARQVTVEGNDILVKELEDGSHAVGLFNTGPVGAVVAVRWQDLGLEGPLAVRDLWRRRDLGIHEGGFAAEVASHGVVLLRVTKDDSNDE